MPTKTKNVIKVNKKEDVSSVGNRLVPLLRFLSDSDSFSSSKVLDCCHLSTQLWFDFLFLFLEFTTEPWLFSKNIQSQTSLSKWHSSHWLNATKEFSPWTSGIQSWDFWGALDRWLLISCSLNTLFWEDVASPRKREQDDGASLPPFKMKWTVFACQCRWWMFAMIHPTVIYHRSSDAGSWGTGAYSSWHGAREETRLARSTRGWHDESITNIVLGIHQTGLETIEQVNADIRAWPLDLLRRSKEFKEFEQIRLAFM